MEGKSAFIINRFPARTFLARVTGGLKAAGRMGGREGSRNYVARAIFRLRWRFSFGKSATSCALRSKTSRDMEFEWYRISNQGKEDLPRILRLVWQLRYSRHYTCHFDRINKKVFVCFLSQCLYWVLTMTVRRGRSRGPIYAASVEPNTSKRLPTSEAGWSRMEHTLSYNCAFYNLGV